MIMLEQVSSCIVDDARKSQNISSCLSFATKKKHFFRSLDEWRIFFIALFALLHLLPALQNLFIHDKSLRCFTRVAALCVRKSGRMKCNTLCSKRCKQTKTSNSKKLHFLSFDLFFVLLARNANEKKEEVWYFVCYQQVFSDICLNPFVQSALGPKTELIEIINLQL